MFQTSIVYYSALAYEVEENHLRYRQNQFSAARRSCWCRKMDAASELRCWFEGVPHTANTTRRMEQRTKRVHSSQQRRLTVFSLLFKYFDALIFINTFGIITY